MSSGAKTLILEAYYSAQEGQLKAARELLSSVPWVYYTDQSLILDTEQDAKFNDAVIYLIGVFGLDLWRLSLPIDQA